MRLCTLHCFFLTLISAFYIFSITYPYLSLHSVFLFSPSYSYPCQHETHSTIYNFHSISVQPSVNITEIEKYFIVYEEEKVSR